MGAGTITLRLDDLLVGVAGDSVDTLERCRAEFAGWADDTDSDIAPAFDLRLAESSDGCAARSVPQLRLGASVIARSRAATDVITALDSILGGVHAQRTQPERVWVLLRTFVHGDRAVLVDARAPMLVNDPLLARRGIVEIPTWAVAVTEYAGEERPAIAVPAALRGRDDERRFELVGLVSVGDAADGVDNGGAGSVLARYGSRHTSPAWFRTLSALLDDDRFAATTDRLAARHAIEHLLSVSV